MGTELITGHRLKGWMGRVSGTLGIPPELALDLPKATLIGTGQLQIENHKGVLEYTSRRVRVRSRMGEIVVSGSRLRIGSIFQDEIVIEGNILHIELSEGGGGA